MILTKILLDFWDSPENILFQKNNFYILFHDVFRKGKFIICFVSTFSAKDEGLGACAQTRVRRRIFSLFPMMVGSQVMRSATKNTFCFLSLIRCLVKFVVLESHSQSLWVLNQYHITINTHLLSHIATFCLSLQFFAQTKFVSLLLLLSFFWLATIQLEAFF